MTKTTSAAVSAPFSIYDPWDPMHALRRYGRYRLTSVELTVTHLCNMRCEHCAVGDALVTSEAERLPLVLVLKRLEEAKYLETLSITGGEPSFSDRALKEYVLPILQYAKRRGLKTQVNTNLTLDYGRYELIAPYVDVMHITFNYENARDFYEIGFARTPRPVPFERASALFERMVDNARRLAASGVFVSAESMMNRRTHERLDRIHRLVAEMGCRRHEVHPMYASSFAAGLPTLSLAELRRAIGRLLDARDPNVWMLFGTLPFFACSDCPEDLELIMRLRQEPNVTVRNDPDGRIRLNVDVFSGNVFVTDFASLPALGNIRQDRLDDVLDRWLEHPLAKRFGCRCPEASCCGPNLLVADMYYKDTDFTARRAKV